MRGDAEVDCAGCSVSINPFPPPSSGRPTCHTFLCRSARSTALKETSSGCLTLSPMLVLSASFPPSSLPSPWTPPCPSSSGSSRASPRITCCGATTSSSSSSPAPLRWGGRRLVTFDLCSCSSLCVCGPIHRVVTVVTPASSPLLSGAAQPQGKAPSSRAGGATRV